MVDIAALLDEATHDRLTVVQATAAKNALALLLSEARRAHRAAHHPKLIAAVVACGGSEK